MTDLPTLKLKSLVNFPANSFGGTGITVRKQTASGGAFFTDLDYSKFVPVASIPSIDIPNLYTLIWNSLTGVFSLAPIALIGQIYQQGNTVVVTAAGAVAVGSNDTVIAFKKTVPAASIANLPLAANKAVPVHIVDAAMNAGTFNITINPAGAETINGLPNWTIAGDGGFITLFPIPGVGYVT